MPKEFVERHQGSIRHVQTVFLPPVKFSVYVSSHKQLMKLLFGIQNHV